MAADPEVVWEVLTAIDDWPGWNPDVTVGVPGGGADRGLPLSVEGGAGHDHLDAPAGRAPAPDRLDRQDARAQGDPRLAAGGARRRDVRLDGGILGRAFASLFRKRMQKTLRKRRGRPGAPEGRGRAPSELAQRRMAEEPLELTTPAEPSALAPIRRAVEAWLAEQGIDRTTDGRLWPPATRPAPTPRSMPTRHWRRDRLRSRPGRRALGYS